MIVTTSLSVLTEDVEVANRFAVEIDATYVPRERETLSGLQKKYNVLQFVVVENGQPVVYHGAERFFFHRGMAELRILNLQRSGHDPMIAAMGLKPGMSVLDCTLGLAADALVASFVVGVAGKVQGIEASPLIAALTRWGLLALGNERADARPPVKEAARRISVTHADHLSYLACLPDRSFDVVFFDPMFRQPKEASVGIQALRNFADSRSLTIESIRQAQRVARCRVVVKEAHGSPEFSRLGIQHFGGGRYSPVQYGILSGEGPA